MKITIAGAGYVGLSLATLLAQKHHVTLLDIVQEKVDMINNRRSPIADREIEDFFANKKLYLTATTDWREALKEKDFVVIATPTNYDEEQNHFDTSSVEDIIEKVKLLAEDQDRSFSQYVNLVLKEYLRQLESKSQ